MAGHRCVYFTDHGCVYFTDQECQFVETRDLKMNDENFHDVIRVAVKKVKYDPAPQEDEKRISGIIF